MTDSQTHEIDWDATIIRFTVAQRVQHIVLVIVFVVLIITGLPLLIPGIGPRVVEGAVPFARSPTTSPVCRSSCSAHSI